MLTIFNDVLFSSVSLYFIGQQFIKKAIRSTFIINTCILVTKDVISDNSCWRRSVSQTAKITGHQPKRITLQFFYCSFVKLLFQFFIFWISNGHEQKAHFVMSSIVTSQKRNLKFKSDKLFNFVCIVFLLTITFSNYILLMENFVGVSNF